ncbi:ribokinase [Limnovirga soli]|uniref:Ribokinase n=1 Tax=Limnovirga soli TaxID=2656915 RepID=A0A8J8JR95_9BACT|nr:ribokinase [Limnovirga soli]NNV55622.1 ribokinase [Limnovirga soli]
MSSKKILVVGSSNTDMVIKSAHIPKPGETIIGGTFFMNAGGKGANQAVAAARLGGDVDFIAKTGNDIFGKQALALFNAEGIHTQGVLTDAAHPSGVAMITVDDKGENSIVVASGANAALTVDDIKAQQALVTGANMVLLQLEIPMATVEYVAAIASAANKIVVLNPAPAMPLSDVLLQNISIITPNEHEAALLTGILVNTVADAETAAHILHAKGVANIIITMGAKGALLFTNGQFVFIDAIPVTAIDTTAAGDVFNGALVVALANGSDITAAVRFAVKAAAIAVTRLGAQASAPYLNEVENL